MENTALCHVPVGTVSNYMLQRLTSPIMFVPPLTAEYKRETHSLAPSFSRFDSFGFFLLGVCKRQCLSWKSAKCEWGAWQTHQSCRVCNQWNAFQYPVRNWISSWCVAPLMVPILRST